MADGLNQVNLIGNLGADPELRFGQGSGSAVLKMRLAINGRYKSGEEWKDTVEWVSVVVFGARAEGLQKILGKGDRIGVVGRLSTRSYEKDGQKYYSTEVVANEIILCGGGAREDSSQFGPPRGRDGGRDGGRDSGREQRRPPPTQDRPNFGRPPAQAPQSTQADDGRGYPPNWDDNDDIPY